MNPEILTLTMLPAILIPIIGYITYSYGKLRGVRDLVMKKRIDDMRFK